MLHITILMDILSIDQYQKCLKAYLWALISGFLILPVLLILLPDLPPGILFFICLNGLRQRKFR
jgi:hypothetical protein